MTLRALAIFVGFAIVSLVFASDAHFQSDRGEFKKSLAKNCDDSYSLTCLKLDAVSWVEKLSENNDISVFPGLSLVRENNSAGANTGDIVAELAREFPDDPNARLDAFLMRKITGFLGSHAVKLNLKNVVEGDPSTARKKGGGGGGGGMGMALAAGAMMKGMMMAMGLAAVAAMAGKALMAALIALMLSALAALKGGGGGGHSTYEVVAKPVYTSSHSHSTSHEGHGGHGWERSFGDAPLPLGLQPGYTPPQ